MDRLEWWVKRNYPKLIKSWGRRTEINIDDRSIVDIDRILIELEHEKMSIICHKGSYGYEKGLLELWDFENEPIGYLNAEQVKRIIKRRIKK